MLRACAPVDKLALIPSRHYAVLRLRWQDEPGFWARLLTAAQESDDEALAENHLHAKLLLSGTLVAQCNVSKV